ncbi:MAG TPA: hypothetical protein DCX22_02035 [Dehalococcoidia bacterium]|nr:hypothetical protein [Dehalococcoidia bacterium]
MSATVSLFKTGKTGFVRSREIPVLFGNHGVTLHGKVLLPAGAGVHNPVPGAILCHGFGAGHKAMESSALLLANRGIAAIVFDLRGHGESGGVLDDGCYEDILDAYQVFTALPEIDESSIALIGHSLGAFSSILAAQKLKKKPKAIVALSCPADVESKVLAVSSFRALLWLRKVIGWFWSLTMRYSGLTVRINWKKFLGVWAKAKISVALSDLGECAKLFVFCRDDTITPYRRFSRIFDKVKGNKKQIVTCGTHSTPIEAEILRFEWVGWTVSALTS